MNERGGYRIKTELQLDLDEIKQHAEVSRTITELLEGVSETDRRSILTRCNKIKKLADKWLGGIS